MENITRIADLPMNGGGNGNNMPAMQNQMTLPSVSISEMKKKNDIEMQTNYTPINPHPNPFGISEQNPVMQNPDNQRLEKPAMNMEQFQQTGGLPEEFRNRISTMQSQPLPSRDIPMQTEHYNIDENVQPNYIPKPKKKVDFVENHHDMTEQNLREYEQKRYRENKLDAILDDLQMPIFVALLFFLFQLPMINTMIFKRFSFLSIYNEDGNFNFYGLLLKSLLFGNFFLFSNKIINFISTL